MRRGPRPPVRVSEANLEGSKIYFATRNPGPAKPRSGRRMSSPFQGGEVGSPLGFQVAEGDRDGKIEDFDAAPLERPKWPLPLSFFFSPRAAFHLPGVPALRSAKALSSDLQPRKRGLRPAVTEGDKRREGISPTSDGELKIRRAYPAKGKAL